MYVYTFKVSEIKTPSQRKTSDKIAIILICQIPDKISCIAKFGAMGISRIAPKNTC